MAMPGISCWWAMKTEFFTKSTMGNTNGDPGPLQRSNLMALQYSKFHSSHRD